MTVMTVQANPMETPWDITEDKSMWENLKTWPKRYSKDTSESKVKVIDDVQDDIYKKQLVSKPEVIDEESDVIDWTPEEKEEKKSQVPQTDRYAQDSPAQRPIREREILRDVMCTKIHNIFV